MSHTEKAVQVAGSVHGRDHPVMESYWQAVAEAKLAVSNHFSRVFTMFSGSLSVLTSFHTSYLDSHICHLRVLHVLLEGYRSIQLSL